MGAHYCIEFEIDIDPQKETALNTQISDAGFREDIDYWFQRDEEQSRTALCVDIDDHMSYSCVSALEEFITNHLEPAAKSTVLVAEGCDGDVNVFAIGPDSEDCMSEYHKSEARKHLKACKTSDLKVIHEWLDDRLTP